MTKLDAIRLLGGTAASAARHIGISPSAISLWPDELTAAIADRVQAAIARQHLAPEVLGIQPGVAPDLPIADPRRSPRLGLDALSSDADQQLGA